MSLPRIFIEVTGEPAGNWTVTAGPCDDGPELASYAMDSVEVEVGGRALHVPVVPASRREPLSPEVDALCAGDTDAIAALLDRLARGRTRAGDVCRYGRWLFECLLAPAWRPLTGDPGVAAARGMELALMWDAGHAGLHSLVWEAMIDRQDRPLAGLPDTLVVITRVVRADYPERDTITRAPRVLFASGASLTDEVIRPGAMFVGLLRKFDADGLCVSRAVQEVSLSDLADECETFRPDVVHLVAHGETRPDGGGVLLLGGQDSRSAVGAGQLLRALRAGGDPMAVVLSACHSGGGPGDAAGDAGEPVSWRAAPLAAELVAGGIPIVTAMAGTISEPACRMYTTRLIDAIHQGKPLSRAAAEGRAAALTAERDPFRHLDWAMPAIFLASSVKPGFRPLDPAAVDRIAGIADALKLRKAPVFIGRQKILATLDDLFPTRIGQRPPGCVVIYSEEPLDKLGSTRLLEETGFRLLRAGHVPLLLANYPEVGFGDDSAAMPHSLRTLLCELLTRAVDVVEKFDLPPPRLRALGVDPRFAGDAAVTGAGLAGKEPWEARQEPLRALAKFRSGQEGAPPLEPSLVRAPLARDLAELAGIMARAGEPFGSHTRVVLLADRVHQWTGALGPLLAMVESTGLGTEASPVPVVLTASVGTPEGQRVRLFMDERPLHVVPRHTLTRLTAEEATLGFQWVLLSQWHPLERYRFVYAAARDTPHEVARRILGELDGEPASVRRSLYQVIRGHVPGEFEEDNDKGVFEAWARDRP